MLQNDPRNSIRYYVHSLCQFPINVKKSSQNKCTYHYCVKAVKNDQSICDRFISVYETMGVIQKIVLIIQHHDKSTPWHLRLIHKTWVISKPVYSYQQITECSVMGQWGQKPVKIIASVSWFIFTALSEERGARQSGKGNPSFRAPGYSRGEVQRNHSQLFDRNATKLQNKEKKTWEI